MSSSHSLSAAHIAFHDYYEYYRGSAKVPLVSLEFDGPNVEINRYVSDKHAQDLADVFEHEGCDRIRPEHRVPALISESLIDTLLGRSNISRADFDKYPVIAENVLLCNEIKFKYLRGRRRIKAARIHLPENDAWWAVDFFSDGKTPSETILRLKGFLFFVELPLRYQNAIKSQYCHSRKFSDGDIYLNLRLCERQGNKRQAEFWMNRFENKQADIKTLGQEANRALRLAFDDLLPFVGLWADFKVGMLKRVLTMKCIEVTTLLHALY